MIGPICGLRPEGKRDLYGLCTPTKEGEDTFDYGIGEDEDCITKAWSKFYKEFLPQMGYESAEETDYKIYYEKGRSGQFCELWIPIKKK